MVLLAPHAQLIRQRWSSDAVPHQVDGNYW